MDPPAYKARELTIKTGNDLYKKVKDKKGFPVAREGPFIL